MTKLNIEDQVLEILGRLHVDVALTPEAALTELCNQIIDGCAAHIEETTKPPAAGKAIADSVRSLKE